MKPKSDFKLLFLLCKNEKLLCLFTLRFKRTYTAFKLGKNIPQANKIFLRLIEFFVSVVAAISVMGNSRRFLKHITALTRL